eukprot:COSAG01_NODE_4932_length_4605_cov_70.743351_5_plen_105_part_00
MKNSRATTFADFRSDSCGQKSSSKSFQIALRSETEISVPAVEFTAVLIKKYSVSGSPCRYRTYGSTVLVAAATRLHVYTCRLRACVLRRLYSQSIVLGASQDSA